MSITARPPAHAPQQPDAAPAGTPLLVAVPDAARLLGIGTTFAWELVRAGAIPSVKLGRRVLVPRAALERLAGLHAAETETQYRQFGASRANRAREREIRPGAEKRSNRNE